MTALVPYQGDSLMRSVGPLAGLRSRRRQSGATRRRQRRCGARDARTKTQLLESLGVKLSGRVQAMRLLKLLHGLHRGFVPLAARFHGIRAVLCQRLLDLRNAVGSGRLLAALPPPGSFRRSFPVRGASCRGSPGLLWSRALRSGYTRKHTQPRCQEQRTSQVCHSSEFYAHFV